MQDMNEHEPDYRMMYLSPEDASDMMECYRDYLGWCKDGRGVVNLYPKCTSERQWRDQIKTP